MIDIVVLIGGLLLAVYGADKLVDGGAAIAKRYSIPEVLIGAIIVGFGTSMPEFTVNLLSSIHRQPDLAITNILGSNIFNILLILGVAALLRPLHIHEELRKREIPYSLIAIIVVGVCGNEIYLDHLNFSALIPSDGIVFLFFFAIFLYFSIHGAGREPTESSGESDGPPSSEEAVMSPLKASLFILFGLIAGRRRRNDSSRCDKYGGIIRLEPEVYRPADCRAGNIVP